MLAIEDSQQGLQAALTAGVLCAVFYNDYSFGESFAGAALVARSLEGFQLDRLAELCLSPDGGPRRRAACPEPAPLQRHGERADHGPEAGIWRRRPGG